MEGTLRCVVVCEHLRHVAGWGDTCGRCVCSLVLSIVAGLDTVPVVGVWCLCDNTCCRRSRMLVCVLSRIYIYGEAWDFGEVVNNARGINCGQMNLSGKRYHTPVTIAH